MKVAAIIPSFYEVDKDYLKLCVESLRDSGFKGEIIVVTNGTKSNPIINDIRGITRHLHTRDQGQCIATNIGAQSVAPDTDYLFVINSDMYFAPGWLNYVEGTVWPPVWSPNLIEPENNNGSADPFLKLDAGFALSEFDKDKVDKFVKLHEDNTEEPGFNLPFFIKKDFWQFLGGYDVAYDPWGSNSDTDLQTRINLAGVTPMRLRDVLVYHFSNKSGTFDGTHQDYYMNNIEYFRDKFKFDRDELGSDVWYNKDMLPTDGRETYKQEPYENLS